MWSGFSPGVLHHPPWRSLTAIGWHTGSSGSSFSRGSTRWNAILCINDKLLSNVNFRSYIVRCYYTPLNWISYSTSDHDLRRELWPGWLNVLKFSIVYDVRYLFRAKGSCVRRTRLNLTARITRFMQISLRFKRTDPSSGWCEMFN